MGCEIWCCAAMARKWKNPVSRGMRGSIPALPQMEIEMDALALPARFCPQPLLARLRATSMQRAFHANGRFMQTGAPRAALNAASATTRWRAAPKGSMQPAGTGPNAPRIDLLGYRLGWEMAREKPMLLHFLTFSRLPAGRRLIGSPRCAVRCAPPES